jgi:Fe2+ transport system protein B
VPKGTQKKNQRPLPKTEEEVRQEEERKKLEEERKRLEEEVKNAVVDDEVIKIKTNLVNVDAVVYNKKTGQIITCLSYLYFSL